MADSNIVIVESPAKAKTINKYLGDDFHVIASFGHVRDLPPKDGSVDPDADFRMLWRLDDRGERQINEITKAVKGARRVFLATDPDREGEAISWHVREVLENRLDLSKTEVLRITFNEVTKSAIENAIASPRALNTELIEAYLARRALDYLVGFNLSPVLWRKLPGSRSAGRVQSVALRLICEREAEIEKFVATEYWTLEAEFKDQSGVVFPARLTHLDGEKLGRYAIGNGEAAEAARAKLAPVRYAVQNVERKQVRRNPSPPFITSSLQMEASRKLGFGATRTMRVAQKLYEGVDIGGETVGLITYMRTDGVALSQDAINAARTVIGSDYGDPYLPAKPRIYKSTAKNAQEAHEAIRPTDLQRRPAQTARYLADDERRLYDLIWRRTIACEMESAVFEQVAVDISDAAGSGVFRATGQVVKFDGFLKVYEETKDDDGKKEQDRRLPDMNAGEAKTLAKLTPEQHFTQPPPRFSEASLVKRMEELGIGRPSTYASILQVLQDRNYVTLDKRRFLPEDRGRLVTTFLTSFFQRYVEYDFTAQMETRLDEVSAGQLGWKVLLRDFWDQFKAAVDATKDLTITQVLDALDEELGAHFFGPPSVGEDGQPHDPRVCKACGDGRLGLKLGKFGAFIGCSNYPGCQYTRPLSVGGADGQESEGPRVLGDDPATGLPVSIRRGPYGAYAQLGLADQPPEAAPEPVPEPEPGKKKSRAKKPAAPKPKRVSLPKGMIATDVDLDTALGLLSLPRDLGSHPESGEMVQAGIGRFGPFLKVGTKYASLPADEDVLSIGMNRAVVVLAESKSRGSGVLRELGEHPKDGKPITLNNGRFGPYVKHGKAMASLRKANDPDTITVEEAMGLLAEKAARDAAKAGKAPPKDTGEPPGEGKAAAKPATKAKTAAKPKVTAKPKTTTKPKSTATPKTPAKPAAKRTATAKKPAAAAKTGLRAGSRGAE